MVYNQCICKYKCFDIKWGEFINMIGKIIVSFSELGIGMIFIDLILLILIIVLIKYMKVKKVYEKFSDKLKYYDVDEQLETKDKVLRAIIDSFVRTAQSGVMNINLETIINRNLDKSLINEEKNIKLYYYIINLMGILGTFLYLIISTMDYDKIVFSKVIMSFWPIIFAMGANLLLKIIKSIITKRKEEFYFLLEDYLENNIYTKHILKQNIETNNIEDIVDKMENLENKIVGLEKTIQEAASMSQRVAVILNDSTNKFRYNVNLLHSDLGKVHEVLRNRG